MPTIEIGGVTVHYGAFPELESAVEKNIERLDVRLKKLDTERKALRRQRRALKAFLGGHEKKPAGKPAAPVAA